MCAAATRTQRTCAGGAADDRRPGSGQRADHYWTGERERRRESWPDHDGVMSELDVIVIHIRAGQAAEYERLFAESDCHAGGSSRHEVPSSAPGSPAWRLAPITARTWSSTSSRSRCPIT